jgi:hypothetical protein
VEKLFDDRKYDDAVEMLPYPEEHKTQGRKNMLKL